VIRARGARRPLGSDFTRLLAAAVVNNLGDGVRLAAGPLLVAALTSDPALVGGAVFVQQLPWLLLSLPVGAYVDRLDRRRLLVGVSLSRALLAAVLTVAVATGTAGVPLVYVVLFAVGVAEVVADNTSSALVPALVAPDELPRANARLTTALLVGNQFAGPPLGAWLFVAGAAVPFGAEAAGFALTLPLLLGVKATRPAATLTTRQERGWLRQDVTEGLRWLWHQPAIRLLALVLTAMNVTFMAAFAVWVNPSPRVLQSPLSRSPRWVRHAGSASRGRPRNPPGRCRSQGGGPRRTDRPPPGRAGWTRSSPSPAPVVR